MLFRYSKALQLHMQVHEGRKVKEYQCETCENTFSQVNDLNRHINTVHVGKKDYKCNYCEKTFSFRQTLNNHIYTIHEGHNKDYNCDECGKTFSQEGHLKSHMIRVNKEGHKYDSYSKYVCDICEQSFIQTNARQLKRHLAKVHNHKPY